MARPICLICDKEQDGGWNPNRCTCMGARCNICKQLYLGLSGDCLCTDVTAAEYRAIGKLKLDTKKAYYNPPFLVGRTIAKTTTVGMGLGVLLAGLMGLIKGFDPLAMSLITACGVIGGIGAGVLLWITHPPQYN